MKRKLGHYILDHDFIPQQRLRLNYGALALYASFYACIAQ